MIEFVPLLMFLVVCALLMLGYPVAITLAGVALIFAATGVIGGVFDPALLLAMPDRIYGIMTNEALTAVPLFVFMGVMLEKSRIAEALLENMARAFRGLPGGLGISVVVVGMFLAASTGIVGATVVAMGLMSLPTMLKRGYDPRLATGTICATGTLGQIIPPSITLILLGEVLSNAYQRAQLASGSFNTETLSIGDLFAGAVIPGLLLVCAYAIYLLLTGILAPQKAPRVEDEIEVRWAGIFASLAPPLILIIVVLGSIIAGIATPSEAAGVGAFGALIMAGLKNQLHLKTLRQVMSETLRTSGMVFLILIGASVFSLVFRGFGGEHLIQEAFNNMPGGVLGAVIIVMVVIFLLGFILDFIEITFVVVPIVGPVLLAMGVDPVWLGIMIALNLQTSFLTPPFGFSLFYLRAVAPDSVETLDIYRGVIPFVLIQMGALVALAIWPQLATWLPALLRQ
jgi:tripartite ATP-independent transporter DctM subunit